ncbi:MAG TPA: sulfotransferase [Pilimelia sp.]|nr:sulfotransferase [Pilimelia sp.]
MTVRQRAHAAARAVSRGYGRCTARARMTPGFLIVGAQRCGTTSLYKTLRQHPAVLPAVWHKGVHYFDTHYDRPFSWYRGHFPTRRRAEAVRRAHGAVTTGESSPYYLFHPLAAERIARDLPDVRLLVLLRDPVERAYSAHAHELARGFETLPFAEALAAEPRRLADAARRLRADPLAHHHSLRHHAYLARGRYVDQLRRLAELVGRDRLHVVDADEFFAAPRPAFDAVCEFLGLPRCDDVVFGRHNARARAPMPARLRAELTDHFAPYDAELARWWGRVPSWRR